jgi:hypothetical protein
VPLNGALGLFPRCGPGAEAAHYVEVSGNQDLMESASKSALSKTMLFCPFDCTQAGYSY